MFGLKFYFNFYFEQNFLQSWIKNRKDRSICKREVRKQVYILLELWQYQSGNGSLFMQLPKWSLPCFSLEKKDYLGMWVIQWYQLLESWFLQHCPGYWSCKPGRKNTTVLWRNQMCRGKVVNRARNLQAEGQKTREERWDRACKLGESKV